MGFLSDLFKKLSQPSSDVSTVQDVPAAVELSSAPDIDQLRKNRDKKALTETLLHNDLGIKWRAALALCDIGHAMDYRDVLTILIADSKSIPFVAGLLANGTDWDIRAAICSIGAVHSLGYQEIRLPGGICKRSQITTPFILSLLDSLREIVLNFSDHGVRQLALHIIPPSGDDQIMEIVTAALHDESEHVRVEAAKKLKEINDPRSVEPLIHALQAEFDGKDRNESQSALEITYALVKLGDVRAAELIGLAMLKGRLEVASVAIGAFERWQESATAAVTHLIAALECPNSTTRGCAARCLGAIRDPRAIEPLIGIMSKDHERDVMSQKEVSWVAAEALVKIGEPAVQSLIKNLKNEDSKVRELTGDILTRIGGPEAQRATIEAIKVDEP